MAKIRTLEQLNIQGELPSPKGVALAIPDLCHRDEAGLSEVARVAQSDPASSATSPLPSFTATPGIPAIPGQAAASQAGLSILLVGSRTALRVPLENWLGEECGHTIHAAATGQQALALALEIMPQVVITDWLMPGMDGLEFCCALRDTEWGRLSTTSSASTTPTAMGPAMVS